MATSQTRTLLSALLALLTCSGVQAQSKGDLISFQKQISPIFRASCIGCHSEKSAMGGLILTSYAKTMKGGKGGAQVIPGKSAESRLVKYLIGTAQPKMPIGGSLKTAEIDLIKKWVDQGAKIDPSLPDTQAPPPLKMPMRATPAPVTALLFLDNKTLLVGTYKQVQFWNIETKTMEKVWDGHADNVRSLALTKSGKRLVAAGGSPGAGGEIRVLNLETSATVLTLNEHSDIVNTVVITPDDKKIISASTDKSIKIWEMETGKLLNTLRDHADAVYGLAITPNGKVLASCSADRSVKVWNLDTAKRIYSLDAHDDWIFSLAISPNGSRLISTSADSSAKLWNFGEGGSGVAFGIGHSGAALASAFASDNQRFATASADKSIKLYRADGNNYKTLTDAKDWVYSVRYSPNDKLLVGGTWDGSILIWNTDTFKLETTLSTLVEAKKK
ncbi:MAG: hypothetical protein NT023_09380 [Armatimonadetes bacterium]|nr:hypothetical protein [Armatimonadota bacterium]